MNDRWQGARGYELLAALLFTVTTFLVGPHIGFAAVQLTEDSLRSRPDGWWMFSAAAGAWIASVVAVLSCRSMEPLAVLKRLSPLGWCLVSMALLAARCALLANALRN